MPGHYALAVFKCRNTDAAASATYRITAGASGLYLRSPNGGEKLGLGETHEIRWDALGPIGNSVNIFISRNGGTSWTFLTAAVGTSGQFNWTVSGAVSNYCKIKVQSVSNPSYSDVSDAVFSIVSRSIHVVSPVGGEKWSVGRPTSIEWNTVNAPGPVKIELTRNRGISWTTLEWGWNQPSPYTLTVQGAGSDQCRVRVAVNNCPGVSDQSDAGFSIVTRTITVTGPPRHSVWGIGEQRAITWSSTNVDGNVSIAISRDGRSTYSAIAFGVPNTGSYLWTVTAPASGDCYLRVTSDNHPSVSGTNTYVFAVSPMVSVPCQVTLQDWVASPALGRWACPARQVSTTSAFWSGFSGSSERSTSTRSPSTTEAASRCCARLRTGCFWIRPGRTWW